MSAVYPKGHAVVGFDAYYADGSVVKWRGEVAAAVAWAAVPEANLAMVELVEDYEWKPGASYKVRFEGQYYGYDPVGDTWITSIDEADLVKLQAAFPSAIWKKSVPMDSVLETALVKVADGN